MNKEKAIKEIKKESEIFYACDYIKTKVAESIISQIDEPQKPVVPKFVAEWIEEARAEEYSLYGALEMAREATEDWIFGNDKTNQETFARAWLAYPNIEVEKEKLYTVEIPNPHSYIGNHSRLARNYEGKVVLEVQDWLNTLESYKLTESEIKQDFEWAFQFASLNSSHLASRIMHSNGLYIHHEECLADPHFQAPQKIHTPP